jgi:hypothetical protein
MSCLEWLPENNNNNNNNNNKYTRKFAVVVAADAATHQLNFVLCPIDMQYNVVVIIIIVVVVHQFNFVLCPINIQHEIPAPSSGSINKGLLFILHSLIDILTSMILSRFIGRFVLQNGSAVHSVLLVSVFLPPHIIWYSVWTSPDQHWWLFIMSLRWEWGHVDWLKHGCVSVCHMGRTLSWQAL